MAYSPASIIAASVVLPLLAIIAVILRLLVRTKVRPTYIGLDDWFAVGAAIFSVADAANLIVGATIGFQGRDYTVIPLDRFVVESKSDYAQLIIEKPLYGMIKLSAVFFYRRIFTVNTKFRLFSNAVIVLIIAWTVVFMFACIFSCGVHISLHWQPDAVIGPPQCIDLTALNLTYSVTDTVGDFLVILMPFPMIRKLHTIRREKVGLTAIFTLGALSTAASVVRLGFISKAYTQNFSGGGNTHESGVPPAVWSTVEAQIGVLAVYLPPLGPLIRKTHVPSPVSILPRSLFRQKERKAVHGRDETWNETQKEVILDTEETRLASEVEK